MTAALRVTVQHGVDKTIVIEKFAPNTAGVRIPGADTTTIALALRIAAESLETKVVRQLTNRAVVIATYPSPPTTQLTVEVPDGGSLETLLSELAKATERQIRLRNAPFKVVEL